MLFCGVAKVECPAGLHVCLRCMQFVACFEFVKSTRCNSRCGNGWFVVTHDWALGLWAGRRYSTLLALSAWILWELKSTCSCGRSRPDFSNLHISFVCVTYIRVNKLKRALEALMFEHVNNSAKHRCVRHWSSKDFVQPHKRVLFSNMCQRSESVSVHLPNAIC